MSNITVCDRCGRPVESRHSVLDEYAPGDGNAWSVEIYINRIDARGPQLADLCTGCRLALLAAMLGSQMLEHQE